MKKKLLYLIITFIFSFQFMANPFMALALEENITTTETQIQENGIVNDQVTPGPETTDMNNSNLSAENKNDAITLNEAATSANSNVSPAQNNSAKLPISNGNTELDRFLDGNETSIRISGPNRYESAINVSKWVNNSSEKVILVSSDDFRVALASSNLIDSKYPVLFVDQTLSTNTLNEIKRLNANEVFLVGDEKLIPKSVEDQLASIENLKITRFTGTDSYDICKKHSIIQKKIILWWHQKTIS